MLLEPMYTIVVFFYVFQQTGSLFTLGLFSNALGLG
jgi:hypothetical protein